MTVFRLTYFLACLLAVPHSGLGHGAYHDVVAGLIERLRTDPENAALHLDLARAHVDHEEWRLALAEIEIVESIEPGAHRTDFLRGLALQQAGQLAPARTALDIHLKECPGDAAAWVARGRLRMAASDWSGAVDDLSRGRMLSGEITSDVWVDSMGALASGGNPADASRLADEAVGQSGPDPSILLTALEIETAAGLWDAALRRVEALKTQAPRPEPWLAKRARILGMAGRPMDAREAWRGLQAMLLALPNLDRGTPQNLSLLAEAQQALGEVAPAPVVAAPASIP